MRETSDVERSTIQIVAVDVVARIKTRETEVQEKHPECIVPRDCVPSDQVDAARDCILKFGYAKSSLEDIAKQAAISRPLIYRKFKSKEEIFGAVLEDLFETQYQAAEHALAKPGGRREKLMSVYEALLLDPWKELIVDAPMGAEFYGACRRVTPDINERRRKIQLKYTQAVLGTKEVSEVFMLAVDGFTQDLPATKVLRRRLEVLIDRFVRD